MLKQLGVFLSSSAVHIRFSALGLLLQVEGPVDFFCARGNRIARCGSHLVAVWVVECGGLSRVVGMLRAVLVQLGGFAGGDKLLV